jgi:putative colanic acid biosynthesis acetyltransferase WcaF
MRIKKVLLIFFGARVGDGFVMAKRVQIKYPWNLEIGNNVWIGENTWFDSLGKIKIGDNCCISQGAFLLNGNHNYKKTTFDLVVKDIYLEEGAWIGAKGVVFGGVTCRSHSVLTGGSVATKDLEAYSVCQGNPAVKTQERKINL